MSALPAATRPDAHLVLVGYRTQEPGDVDRGVALGRRAVERGLFHAGPAILADAGNLYHRLAGLEIPRAGNLFEDRLDVERHQRAQIDDLDRIRCEGRYEEALAFEVEAGQYIQVIDVEGRQCSDFLAFCARQLAGGTERGLDATTTRNLTGNAYPQPGLFGKFFDQDMRPLVEVVRDTVGRHDTFALACNAKYYEDMGYPGHISCSENFNGQVTPYGIAERKGWL